RPRGSPPATPIKYCGYSHLLFAPDPSDRPSPLDPSPGHHSPLAPSPTPSIRRPEKIRQPLNPPHIINIPFFQHHQHDARPLLQKTRFGVNAPVLSEISWVHTGLQTILEII